MVTQKERAATVERLLSDEDKTIALNIIAALRQANMMGEALQLVSRRFALQFEAVADWYYLNQYQP